MEYLKELQMIENSMDGYMNEFNGLRMDARSLKNTIDNQINEQLCENETISYDLYSELKHKNTYLEKHKSFADFQVPQTSGCYYDLSVYNDGSNDYYPYVFGKTLEHNSETGFISKSDGDKLIESIRRNSKPTLEQIPHASGANRKIEGVTVSNSSINEGKQNFSIMLNNVYPIESAKNIFEMMEVYAMALVIDIPFIEWNNNTLIADIIGYLNAYTTNITAPTVGNTITTKTFLRGNTEDEIFGPYVSQFLIKPFDYGNMPITQKYNPENNPNNGISKNGWLNIQNGITEYNPNLKQSSLKYNYCGRMIGSMVHNDPLYQYYCNATLIAFEQGITATGYDNSNINSTLWADGGAVAVLGNVADVALYALRVAWFQKYHLTLKIRPEVLAQRITLAYNDEGLRSSVPKLNTIKTHCDIGSDLLSLVNDYNISANGEILNGQNYYLNGLYEEGSPTHPSLPAGHAVVAGACVTVMKAMLNTHDSNGDKILWTSNGRTVEQANADGSNLVSYSDTDVSSMTIVGELNKLASNVALGRNFAGVHYRSDGHCGMLSGEEYAISFLQEKIKEFGSKKSGLFNGYDLEKFDGTRVLITADSVTNI